MQPQANLLVTIRNSVDVTYSAYNHFGVFPDGVKGPDHFDAFIRKLIRVWTDKQCTVDNYHQCLPSDMVKSGGWLSRAMYSKYLPAWLSHFQCSQLHLFDVSVDPRTEVGRMYEFIGMPNEAAASNITQTTYVLQANATAAKDYGERRGKNPMNKAIYDPMLNRTRTYLDAYFGAFGEELCDLVVRYPCIAIPLFTRKCKGSGDASAASGALSV
mmetsp:Transcript_21839/g.62225  ORF Transcript_21839/g.62225 Transcript_21839/m.62225 type:complete len:214 (+) Transcript_21839:401-1042(+)